MSGTVDTKRRVKHYVLNDARQWVDRGTGHVSWSYNDKQRAVSLIVKSESDGKSPNSIKPKFNSSLTHIIIVKFNKYIYNNIRLSLLSFFFLILVM